MARRVSLPSADDLFRPTGDETEAPTAQGKSAVRVVPDVVDADAEVVEPDVEEQTGGLRKPSGRIRHDEKMTVYVTSDELLEIEHARLSLRGRHRLAVDRGRLVREALALVLADLDENGEDSMLVGRLRDS